MKKTLKEHFEDYIVEYGGSAELGPGYSEDEYILSFAGSDGPDIVEEGLQDVVELIPFSNTAKIDEYIKEGCSDNWSSGREGYVPEYPTKTWTEYYRELLEV